MKRILFLALTVMLMLSISACGKKQSYDPTGADKAQLGFETEVPATEDLEVSEPIVPLAPSSNKEVVTDEEAPEVFWAMDTAYHLENCPELLDVQYSSVSWDMVKQIQLRQCPFCNPPQYEGYVE
ncbi:MAG: hypothetical protein IKW06_02970 [Clostridia bacterium]|nr:hypothetical protein [Clostridia bacterium]